LAVSVDGAGIPSLIINAELARYQQAQTALGNTVSLEAATQAVRDEFVDNILLAQAAASNGYKVDDAALQSRIDSLDTQIGGPGKLTAWETAMDIPTRISEPHYACKWPPRSCEIRSPPPSRLLRAGTRKTNFALIMQMQPGRRLAT